VVNTILLKEHIKASGKKKGYLAERCGLSRQGFQNKCEGRSDFSAREIQSLCIELGIDSLEEKENIFFA